MGLRFRGLGFDGDTATTQTARTITFQSQGPGEVGAHLGQTSAGEVRLCLGRKSGPQTCIQSDKIDLTATTDNPGKTNWIVTGIGVGEDSPMADLRIVFRSNNPSVTIDGFRFQGTENPGYNGVEADFNVAAGSVHVDGSWSGEPRSWEAKLTDTASGASVADVTGTGNDLVLDAAVSTPRVHLSITNTEAVADQEVFLHAVISWP